MIPTYDMLYMPLLKVLADKEVHTNRELAESVAKTIGLNEEEFNAQMQSSGKSIFRDRINWACTYLKKAGLIESAKRGYQKITSEGALVLANPPAVLDNNFLCRYPSFSEFVGHTAPDETKENKVQPKVAINSNETPSDMLDKAFADLNKKLADDLMTEIMAKDPTFFENLVVKLLLKMGYGGSVSDAGVVTQRSNDGGIDGIIREDKLGFGKIYIQAKRWDPNTTVSRPEIHKFSGALQDNGASKGLFITTAKFSEGAKLSAEKQHIVLVDGDRLTKLMIEYELGVAPVATYQIKNIDTDFFNEEI